MVMKKFGIIGNPLTHSQSPEYFNNKFLENGLDDYEYNKYELKKIDEIIPLVQSEKELLGLNVTIPFKESVLKYMNELDYYAKFIGAVNTIKIIHDREGDIFLQGYNTDAFGFENTLKPHLTTKHNNGLIIGSGGASKAVEFVFKKLGIGYEIVTRRPLKSNHIVHWAVNKQIMDEYLIIINTTPLGMHPGTMDFPSIPYEFVTSDHIMFDLIYNPSKTRFLELGEKAGATVINGIKMFELQADKAWEIWQGKD